MPIRVHDNGPPTISVVLGYGDIGIGRIDETEYKGIGFVQLEQSFEEGEPVPAEQRQGERTLRVFVVLRNSRGLAELRRAVTAIEKEMGVSQETVLDRLTNGYLVDIGQKEAEVERLTYDLKQKQARIDSLFAAIEHGDLEYRAWLKQAIADHFGTTTTVEPQET